MRKGKLYISILLGLCLCLFTAIFTACGKKEAPPPTLENISVSGETEVFIDEFDYADYTITATYSDDSTKTASLTAENLSAEDNAKLSTVGTHALTVSYESVTCSWTVTLKNHDFAGLTFDDVTTTYDGTAKTLAVAGLPTGAQVSYDKATSYTNAGEYTVKATITLANYNPVELTATLTINKAVYDMSGVVFADKTVTYNGQAHSIEATNLPQGVTAQYTGNKQINAGEYEITATFTGDSQNYELIASKKATLTINKATYDMSGVRFENTEVTYDGQTHFVTATGLPSGVSVDWENNGKVNADTYTVTAKFTGDSQNYELIANQMTTLTIHKATITGITFMGAEYTYDGTEKSLAISGTLPNSVTVSYDKETSYTNAGEYTVTAKFSKNANYNDLSDMQATLKINKATYDMSGVVFKDKSVNYTGEAYSIEATNLPEGVSAIYDGNNQTQAGEYTITAHFMGDRANYNAIPDMTAKLIISASDLTGISFHDGEFTYDGTKKSIFITGTLPEGVEVDYANNEQINANSYTVTATFTCTNGNYTNLPELTATLLIKKATYDMSGVVFKDKSVSYTGEIYSLEATNLPNGVTVDYENNDQTQAGEYTVTAIFKGDSQNYNAIPNMTAKLTISASDLTGISFNDGEFTYDGTKKSIFITGTLPDGVEVDYTNNEQINANSYIVTATFTCTNGNYTNLPELTATLTIKKAVYDMSAVVFADNTVTYDGQAHSIEATNLPNGVTAQYTGNKQINAGEYEITATFKGDSANYEPIASKTATLTIKKAVYDMSGVVFVDKTVTYDGQAHSIEATNLPNGVTAQYTGDKQINAGEYEITATFTGDSQNYELIASKTATLTIKQRELTLAFNGETTLKYNGNVQKTITVQATNLVDGDSVELTVSYNGAMIEAGEYIATATLTAHQNYKLTANNTVKVTITRATHTVTFKQDGFAEVTREVLDLADLTDIPTPQHVDGYKFTWNRTDFTSITEDITVTANKELITYKIEYVVYDGVNSASNPTTYTVESATFTLKNPTPSETFGKSFGGWFTSPDFTVENKITKIEKGSFGDLKLYAYWLEYRVTEVVGGTVDYSQATPEITIKVDYGTANLAVKDLISVSDGCTWKLYNGFECLPTQELTAKRLSVSNIGDNIFYILVYHPDSDEYYTDYVLNVYQLDRKAYTFLKDGETWASGEIQEESAVNAPENPEKDGYTFNGWKVNGEFVSFPYTVLTDTEFVADYTLITYTISYELNSGENDDSNPETYNIAQAYTLKNPIRTGYDFKGWFTDETFENQATEITLGSYGDKKFYAKWNIITYTVSYELNGGENNDQNPEAYTVETEMITLANPTKAGYGFKGWYLESSFETRVYTIDKGSHGDKKFYAKWGENTNTLKFDGNGATDGEMSDIEMKTAETVVLPECGFVKAGYTFIGWGTSADGDVVYTDGANYTMGTNAEYTLYAIWQANLNVLKFDGNGATDGGMSDMSIRTAETVNLKKYGYHKNNCYFVGWSLTPDGEVIYENCAEYTMGTESEYTLYAVWGYGTDGIEYILSYGEYMVTGYSGTEKDVKIPSVYNNLLVTSIGGSAFEGCSSLTSVVIPDSVTSIGYMAFYNCSSLTSVYITDLTAWCKISFDGYSANPLYYAGNLYLNNELVTELEIPNTITEIKDYAFEGCSSLTSILIPDSVTSIGYNAFKGCSSLMSVYITDIEAWCNISGIYYLMGDGSSNKNLYLNNEIVTEIEILNTITEIKDYAFYNCSSLTSIKIPNSVISIGRSAFSNCSSLTSVTMPDSVTSISYCAFKGCSSLTSIIIPDSVTSIGDYAFKGCSSLTSIEIPDSVTSIGGSAFYNCSSLTGVYITDIEAWCNISFDGSSANPLNYAKNLYLNNELVTELEIPNTITEIKYYAFSGCSSLTGIEIPNSVTSIGSSAFYNCSGLTSITIPDGVTSIGSFAFQGCSGLTSVVIPDSVTSIGSSAFEGCSSLMSVYITDIEAWCNISGIYYLMGDGSSNKNLYLNNELATDLAIPNTVTEIKSYAFAGCSSLTSIEMPNSVTSIGSSAFSGCSSLTSIEIPNSVTSIGSSAFSGCSSLTSIEIPNSVTSIGYSAFYNCSSLTKIVIPDGVTSIGSSAFRGCSSLTSITIPDGVTSIGSYMFYNCSNLTSITIPDSVTLIGDDAFFNCSSLTSITIPDSVSSIGNYAFQDCRGLTSIEISDSVTLIGDDAFFNCSSLTSVVIPDSVTSIGRSAFYYCSRLTIYCEAESKPSGWSSLWNISDRPVYWYSENSPALNADGTAYDGNYWHYDESGEIVVWVYVKPEE